MKAADVCRSKVRYDNKRRALRYSRVLGRKHGKRFAVYSCDVCDGWHLTTRGNARSAAYLLISELLMPERIQVGDLAARMRVSRWTARWLIEERRVITARASVGLSRAFGQSPEFWRLLGAGRVEERLARRRLGEARERERMKEAG